MVYQMDSGTSSLLVSVSPTKAILHNAVLAIPLDFAQNENVEPKSKMALVGETVTKSELVPPSIW